LKNKESGFMSEKVKFRVGLVLGLVWAVALLWGGARFVNLPMFAVMPTIMTAFFAPGLVIIAMIGRVASRRLFDGEMVGGRLFDTGSKGAIDQKVLNNTIEQLLAALCIWPAAAILLAGDGPGVIMVLGIGFSISRMAFWVGYHRSPALRAFGFGASFYPTMLVGLWVLWQLVTGFS